MNLTSIADTTWRWTYKTARFVLIFILLVLGLSAIDGCRAIHLDTPPEHVKTITDFREWKTDKIISEKRLQHEATSYTMIRCIPTSSSASNASAYLFDKDDKLVDWSIGMGEGDAWQNGIGERAW